VLDLFSGIGGFALGLESTGRFSTAGFVERDEYCRAVLRKHWPDVPQHDDIHTYQAGQFGQIDVITGGFPCQPFSHAGKQRGKEDDRYLWPEMLRVIAQERPTWIIGENVTGIIQMELDTVLFDLESIGYSTRTFVIPACAVDAPHRRNRVWIVAHSENVYGNGVNDYARSGMEGGEVPEPRDSGWQNDVAHSDFKGLEGLRGLRERAGECAPWSGSLPDETKWFSEPDVGRVANGVPSRVDRLRSLGNAVVPQVVAQIGWAISEVT
jgi:DNA (cytosine-5)-methyltransferase 1